LIKIIIFAENTDGYARIEKGVIKKMGDTISLSWSSHPYLGCVRACIITAPHVSKASGAKEVSRIQGIPFGDILGIGDTMGDWCFMKLCAYAGTLENGETELKEKVKTKGNGNYHIGTSVDENGIFEILSYFHILP
jgi:hydroxymethylpyrimidine pyrophosphatase-like HAD family hydrolase